MNDQGQEIQIPQYKKLKEMQKKYNRQNSEIIQSDKQDRSVASKKQELQYDLVGSQSPKSSKSYSKYISANQSPIQKNNEGRTLDRRSYSRQEQLSSLNKSNNIDDSLEQILLSDKKRSGSKSNISQRTLNVETKLQVSNQKIAKIEREIQEKTKQYNQLQSQIKKQNADHIRLIKEKDAKLQRSQDTIYKLKGENEKLQNQLALQLKHQLMLSQQSHKAEETDKELCDLRKNNRVLQEEILYLRQQNQEISKQLMETQNSADFMKRTKEIVNKNEELQYILENIYKEQTQFIHSCILLVFSQFI